MNLKSVTQGSVGTLEPAQELTFFSLEVFVGQKALQDPVGPNTVILAQSREQGQLSDSILLQLTVSKLYTGKDKIKKVCDYLLLFKLKAVNPAYDICDMSTLSINSNLRRYFKMKIYFSLSWVITAGNRCCFPDLPQ